MKKILQVVLTGVAAVVVAGTIASAAPAFRQPSQDLPPSIVPQTPEPTPSQSPAAVPPTVSPTPEPTSSESPDPGPTDTQAPGDSPEPPDAARNDGPGQTEDPAPKGDGVEPGNGVPAGARPDFSACAGLRGLDNAICRHRVLLTLHPENPGLATSLARLEAKLAEHQGHAPGNGAQDRGKSDQAPGHSGDVHGNGSAHSGQ